MPQKCRNQLACSFCQCHRQSHRICPAISDVLPQWSRLQHCWPWRWWQIGLSWWLRWSRISCYARLESEWPVRSVQEGVELLRALCVLHRYHRWRQWDNPAVDTCCFAASVHIHCVVKEWKPPRRRRRREHLGAKVQIPIWKRQSKVSEGYSVQRPCLQRWRCCLRHENADPAYSIRGRTVLRLRGSPHWNTDRAKPSPQRPRSSSWNNALEGGIPWKNRPNGEGRSADEQNPGWKINLRIQTVWV